MHKGTINASAPKLSSIEALMKLFAFFTGVAPQKTSLSAALIGGASFRRMLVGHLSGDLCQKVSA